jgi:hypothetical protein
MNEKRSISMEINLDYQSIAIKFTKAENIEEAIKTLNTLDAREMREKLRLLSKEELMEMVGVEPKDHQRWMTDKQNLFYNLAELRDKDKIAELSASYKNGTFKNEDVKGMLEYGLQDFVYANYTGDNNTKNEITRSLIPFLGNYPKVHHVLQLIKDHKFNVERDLADFTLGEMYSLVKSMTQNHTGRIEISKAFRPYIRIEDRLNNEE